MEKKLRALVVMFVMIIIAGMVTACAGKTGVENRPVKLTMTELSYNDETKAVSWDKVANASGYTVKVGTSEKASSLIVESGGKMQYVLTEPESGTYSVSVTVKGETARHTRTPILNLSARFIRLS